MRCYIGIGSNLDNPERQVALAIEALHHLPRSAFVAASSRHASTPQGPQDQPDFCNAVAAIDCRLPPFDLLRELQAIERARGRIPGPRWGARIVDLDLLLYGDLRMDSALLTVPHPALSKRDFVLYPLAEIAPPDLPIPGLGRLDELVARCPKTHLKTTH